jgi:hypothetical protein
MPTNIRDGGGAAWFDEEEDETAETTQTLQNKNDPPEKPGVTELASEADASEADEIERIQANATEGDSIDEEEDENFGGHRMSPKRELTWSYISHCNEETLRGLLFRRFGQDERRMKLKSAGWLRDRFVTLCFENGHKIDGLPEVYSKALNAKEKIIDRSDLEDGMEVMIFPQEQDNGKNFICITANDRILKIMKDKKVPIPMTHFGVLRDAIKGVIPLKVVEGMEISQEIEYVPRFAYQVFGACKFNKQFQVVKRESMVRAR